MHGFGAGANHFQEGHEARPAVLTEFIDFYSYGDHYRCKIRCTALAILSCMRENGKLEIPSHRSSSARGLESVTGMKTTWQRWLIQVVTLVWTMSTQLLHLFKICTIIEVAQSTMQKGGKLPSWLRLDEKFIKENSNRSEKMEVSDSLPLSTFKPGSRKNCLDCQRRST